VRKELGKELGMLTLHEQQTMQLMDEIRYSIDSFNSFLEFVNNYESVLQFLIELFVILQLEIFKIYNFDNREAVATLNQASHEIQLKSKEVEELRQKIRSNYAEIDHFRRQVEQGNQNVASYIRALNDQMIQLEMLVDK